MSPTLPPGTRPEPGAAGAGNYPRGSDLRQFADEAARIGISIDLPAPGTRAGGAGSRHYRTPRRRSAGAESPLAELTADSAGWRRR